jgi:hypothetical protein
VVLCVLFAWSKGALAEDMNDYYLSFGTPYNDETNGHVINITDVDMPSANQARRTEVSFSDIASNPYSLPPLIDSNSFHHAFEIPISQFPSHWYTNNLVTTFHEIQSASLQATEIARNKNHEYSYSGYESSAPEAETWLMILVGITLIGLQIIRSNKRADPIYSSLS